MDSDEFLLEYHSSESSAGSSQSTKQPSLSDLALTIPIVNYDQLFFETKVLGEGGQGVVKLGRFAGTPVAVKTIFRWKNKDRFVLREIKLLDQIRHPNIVSIVAACETMFNFHIVMEYFDGHSLYKILFEKKSHKEKEKFCLSTERRYSIAEKIIEAIDYLHEVLDPPPHSPPRPEARQHLGARKFSNSGGEVV